MTESQLNQEIFSRYGAVTRARGTFLYTKKGVRLTDLYQAGGRAILGWGGGDSFTRLKNIMNRGLTGTFLTEYTTQIDRAVSELLAKNYELRMKNEELGCDGKICYNVYFFRGKQSALKAALEISPDSTSVWMPWRSVQDSGSIGDAVVIVPPLPWVDDVYILAVSPELQPPSGGISIPSALIAAITRSIYDLIAEIKIREEKDWFIYDTVLTKYFTRKGPYLYPKISETKYDDFVKHCLDAGIVISPAYSIQSIVPFRADKGVFTKLKNSEFPF